MDGDVTIRFEVAADVARVRRVNEAAFGRPGEAALVDRLRANCPDVVSVVAAVRRDGDGEEIVGHALFSPVTIGAVVGAGLGPVAVRPDRQRRGVGAAMIRFGLDELRRRRRAPFVVVLGHPGYYPRFGFVPASRHGVRCTWDVPDDVFMILPLDPGALAGIGETACYRPEFDAV